MEVDQGSTSGQETATTEAAAVSTEATSTAASTGEGQSTSSSEGTQASEAASAGSTAAAQAYQANLKYKVYDQEKSFDPRLAAAIKSKEDEEYIRDLYTKADAVEELKTRRNEWAGKFENLRTQVGGIVQQFDKRDYKGAFQSLGLKDTSLKSVAAGFGWTNQEIIKAAYELAQLTPQEEAAYNQAREFENKNLDLQLQAQQYQQEAQNYKVQTRSNELSSALSKPDISPIVQAFDSSNGSGAFYSEVVKRGQLYWHTQKQDVPVDQLVSEVIKLARGYQQPNQQQAPAQGIAAGTSAQGSQGKLPTIPNVGSGAGASPAGRKFKDTDEMRKFWSNPANASVD